MASSLVTDPLLNVIICATVVLVSRPKSEERRESRMFKSIRMAALVAVLVATVLSATGCPRRTLVLPSTNAPEVAGIQ